MAGNALSTPMPRPDARLSPSTTMRGRGAGARGPDGTANADTSAAIVNPGIIYSILSATMGSTFVARRTGTNVATAPDAASSVDTPTKTTESSGPTAYSRPASAPSAMRSPSSRVRCATVYDTTP